MVGYTLNWCLTKANRVSGWFLLGLGLVYLCTGFAMSQRLGFDHVIPIERALALHRNLVWFMVVLFLAHASLSVYFAMRRWGWIGKPANPQNVDALP